jgi:hypothetical protein
MPLQNGTLRSLDQSWRMQPTNVSEVILVFKLARAVGKPEEMMSGASPVSPSKLWIKGLPGRDQRSSIDGQMQQETYIRVYVPVKTSAPR